MDAQLYERRTIHLVEGNDMTTLSVIGVLAFVIYCFMTEWNCAGKHSPVIVTILRRLVARHIKLAWKLFFAVIYFIVGIAALVGMSQPVKPGGKGGRETEHLAGLFNRVTYFPQLVIEGFLLFLQLFTIALLLGLVGIKDSVVAHPYFYFVATIVIYLVWLVVTICNLVEDEVVSDWTYSVSEDHGGEVAHRILTKEDHITWSALTFVLWIALLFSAPYASGFVAHKVAIQASQASVPASCIGYMGETDPICVQDGDMYFAVADGEVQRFPAVPLGKGWEIAPASDHRWFEVDTSAFAKSVYRCRYATCPAKP
jgi:hypothetical protein